MREILKEVLLVTAPWCQSCHVMLDWFHTIEIPGIVLKSVDIEKDDEVRNENISSVPTILFKRNGKVVQTISGALGKQDLVNKIKSLWASELN